MSTTLRAATSGGGQRRRQDQTARLRRLLEATLRGGFLLPRGYAGCVCEWVCLDSGYAVCARCGAEHWCCCGSCPEAESLSHERVCTITGCVTLENELRAERTAAERVGPCGAGGASSSSGRRRRGEPSPSPQAMMMMMGPRAATPGARCEAIRHVVESTVRELLASDKTRRCLEQERSRNDAKELAVMARVLREVAHDRRCLRPNLVTVAGQVIFQCRKNRAPLALDECRDPEGLLARCTDAIAGLLLLHGGPRVARQMQNSARYRDFVTSLLYLCRVGVSFHGRQVLPRIEILHRLLPLQVLLPTVFKIRSKAITEGENLIKLDLKQLPLS